MPLRLAVNAGEPAILRVPGWEKYAWLRAGFSTRVHGASSVYGPNELNLGWTKEDEPSLVLRNRASFVRAVVGDQELPMVTVSQVHGAAVRDLEECTAPLMTAAGKAVLEGDGLLSSSPGRLLAILTADCVPVLVADTRTHAVGAFHAGWRGTLGRIAERGIQTMRERYDCRPEDLVAAIGPCIQACCFTVGEEVREAFAAEFPYANELFTKGQTGSWQLDLVAANRRQLRAAGLVDLRIQSVGGCTACTRERDGRRRFYSYRAEAGRCGRMLSAIGALF